MRMLPLLLTILTLIKEAGGAAYDFENSGISDLNDISIGTDATTVKLGHNSFVSIPAGYFVNLPDLEELKINAGLVSSIEDFAFQYLGNLTELNLNNQQLTTVSRNMFRGMP